jgi:hypothetical protein
MMMKREGRERGERGRERGRERERGNIEKLVAHVD